jgi:hypothetical protein
VQGTFAVGGIEPSKGVFGASGREVWSYLDQVSNKADIEESPG